MFWSSCSFLPRSKSWYRRGCPKNATSTGKRVQPAITDCCRSAAHEASLHKHLPHPSALLSGHPWPPKFLESTFWCQLPYPSVSCSRFCYSQPITNIEEGAVGVGLPKICGAMDGGTQAPHGCAEGALFRSPTPTATHSEPRGQKSQSTQAQNQDLYFRSSRRATMARCTSSGPSANRRTRA